MSFRTALPQHNIQAQSMASNITSASYALDYLDNVGIQLTWTGTPTGTFSVLASLDGVNFVTLSLSGAPAASGAAGSLLINLNQVPYRYLQVQYTASSGSGTLDGWIMAKKV